jgi:hypothetical protein
LQRACAGLARRVDPVSERLEASRQPLEAKSCRPRIGGAYCDARERGNFGSE